MAEDTKSGALESDMATTGAPAAGTGTGDNAEGVEFIDVLSADPTRVGLHEKHPDHPRGEVFVAGFEPTRVAATPYVQQALERGQIVQVGGDDRFSEARRIRDEETKARAALAAEREAKKREVAMLLDRAEDLKGAALFHEIQAGAMTPPETSREHAANARDQAEELRQRAEAIRTGQEPPADTPEEAVVAASETQKPASKPNKAPESVTSE